MAEVVLKIRSSDPLKDIRELAQLYEMRVAGSKKGCYDLRAHDRKLEFSLFGDNTDPIKATRKDLTYKGIQAFLEEILVHVQEVGAELESVSVRKHSREVDWDEIVDSLQSGTSLEMREFGSRDFRSMAEALSPFAAQPYLGLQEYTWNQLPYQQADFSRAKDPGEMSDFFLQAKTLDAMPVREVLREMYVSHCTSIIEDGREFDRALAYMASQYMGPITKGDTIESLGWYYSPTGLSYNLTSKARAVCHLIHKGCNTPELINRFIAPFEQDLVGTHTYIWDEEAYKLHAILSSNDELHRADELSDRLGIAPSAQPLPEIGATIHYTRVHYPHHHHSPDTERRSLDRMVNLGILKVASGIYQLNE